MKKGDTLDIPQDLKKSIERMLSRTQTKMLFPVITLGLVQSFLRKRRGIFTDLEVRRSYEQAVQDMKRYLGHNLHIGGEYYDAYPSRNMPKYGVIRVLGNKRYRLQPLYQRYARQLARWLPEVIKMSIAERIGVVADLANHGTRSAISSDAEKFIAVVREHIEWKSG